MVSCARPGMKQQPMFTEEMALMPNGIDDPAATGATEERGAAATGADSAAEDAPVALPAGAPDTAATRAVWAALNGNPGATAAELAMAARIGRSTATKTLGVLEGAGLARRERGGLKAGRVLPD